MPPRVNWATDLERFLKGDSLPVNPQAIGRRFEAWAKRRPALATRICTVLLCLGIVEIAYQVHRYTAPPSHTRHPASNTRHPPSNTRPQANNTRLPASISR